MKQFMALELITEMEYPHYSPDLLQWFVALSKNNSAFFKGTEILGCWHKKNDDTESYFTAGVRKMFPTVAALLGYTHTGQWEYFKCDSSQ